MSNEAGALLNPGSEYAEIISPKFTVQEVRGIKLQHS